MDQRPSPPRATSAGSWTQQAQRGMPPGISCSMLAPPTASEGRTRPSMRSAVTSPEPSALLRWPASTGAGVFGRPKSWHGTSMSLAGPLKDGLAGDFDGAFTRPAQEVMVVLLGALQIDRLAVLSRQDVHVAGVNHESQSPVDQRPADPCLRGPCHRRLVTVDNAAGGDGQKRPGA